MSSSRSHQRCFALIALVALTSLSLTPVAEAGFAGTDVFIPASARAAGVSPAQFYSTLWVTNLSTSASANVQLKFFQRDTSNTSPITVPVTIAPGETKKYENVVQTVFGLPSASGAIRVQADREVLASSRTYNLPLGSDIKDANGLFFTGIPQVLAIGNGESSQLQGVSQNGAEDFRYNFGMVETAGSPVTVRIIVRSSDGGVIGTKDYPVQAYEAKQFAVTDAAPAISTVNGRVDATVVAGSGAVLLYATAVANGSQDSIGFEMSYRNSLLSAGVASLNTFTGAVTLTGGSGISISSAVGNQIVITATGGGSAGVSTVNGYSGAVNVEAGTNVSFGPATAGNGIKINATGGASGVTALNGLSGAVTLLTGTGISITPSGNNLTIASSGTSFSLPYSGSATTGASASAFWVSTPGTAANSTAVEGSVSSASAGNLSAGVKGDNAGTGTGGVGVLGTATGGTGVFGSSLTGYGVIGSGNSQPGVLGNSSTVGVKGQQGTATGFTVPANKMGVWGDSVDGYGVFGSSNNSTGMTGVSLTRYGVQALGYGTGEPGAALAAFALASGTPYAAYLNGAVHVTGTLAKGGGSFKIDHPLDPESKYLYHSFVESPDMMNIYNGIVVLDSKGEAAVALPTWFSALNRDFRYQLTCVGGYAPVYISREVESNSFQIAGGKPGLKISWQVTGVRQDAWANANRIPVEEAKGITEKGHYIHPTAFGQPEEKGEDWARNPEMMRELKQQRDRLAVQIQ
jgi:hypothetical protein